MSGLVRWLDRLWFPAVPASRLAMLRILIGLYPLYYVGYRIDALQKIAQTDTSLFSPVDVARLLEQPISPELFQWIVIVTLVTNVLFILGWMHRFVAPLFAVLLLFTLCYRNSWSMIYHSQNLAALHVIILAFTPSAQALSIDAWVRRKFFTPPDDLSQPNWRFGWPIQLICMVTLATYFLAGVAKVMGPLGWSWAMGDALRLQVAVDALRKELLGGKPSELAFLLYDQIWLFTLLGVMTLILEFGAPLFLLNKRLGWLWAINAFLMHWGIYFIMGIKFRYCLCGIVFASFFALERFVPWGHLLFRSQLRNTPEEEIALQPQADVAEFPHRAPSSFHHD